MSLELFKKNEFLHRTNLRTVPVLNRKRLLRIQATVGKLFDSKYSFIEITYAVTGSKEVVAIVRIGFKVHVSHILEKWH